MLVQIDGGDGQSSISLDRFLECFIWNSALLGNFSCGFGEGTTPRRQVNLDRKHLYYMTPHPRVYICELVRAESPPRPWLLRGFAHRRQGAAHQKGSGHVRAPLVD